MCIRPASLARTLGSRLLRRCAARPEVLVGETVRLNMRFLIGASAFSLPTSGLSTKHRTHSRCQDGGLCRWDGVARSRAARLASSIRLAGTSSPVAHSKNAWAGLDSRSALRCASDGPSSASALHHSSSADFGGGQEGHRQTEIADAFARGTTRARAKGRSHIMQKGGLVMCRLARPIQKPRKVLMLAQKLSVRNIIVCIETINDCYSHALS